MNALNRRRNKNSGDGAKKWPPWKYEEEMSFLLPSLDNRNTQGNLSMEKVQNEFLEEIVDNPGTSKSIRDNSVDETNIFNDESSSKENPQERDENESSNIQSETDVTIPSISNKKRKRQEGDNSITQMVKILKENSAIRQIRHDKKKLSSRDLDGHVFLELGKTYKDTSSYRTSYN